ncbi:biotin transporter BioY [Paenibacillus thermoaerophilus]|uniref:Biotin transporter n=1 Tax=Paenibacillus thermoaerophilus TaxID=1215385 RepID=A0ABW2V7V5_9BACL|nr:biotin transporter BioY [Paenibacillus thermoaerophilus]TMV17888.1 biotin transporter BioY [Paenibacillus thermoaerophilus]
MPSSAWNVRGIVFTALFAAVFIVFSMIKLTLWGPVPFTLQNLAIMLAGGLLGARYGFASIMLVVGLTALGLPLLHGEGGWSLIAGRTGGFIWMFPVSALLIGWFSRKIRGHGLAAYILLVLVMEVFGSLLLYVSGVPWFAHVMGYTLAKSLSLAAYPFMLPDFLKALAAAGIVLSVRKYMPGFSVDRSARSAGAERNTYIAPGS